MRLLRIPSSLAVALGFLAVGPVCLANKQAKIDHFTPPVQNYAVIDISGNTATSPVTNIALNDTNQAAFGFYAGRDQTRLQRPYGEYDTYIWKDGNIQASQVISLTMTGDHNPGGGISDPLPWDAITITTPITLLADGSVSIMSFTLKYYRNYVFDIPTTFDSLWA